MKITCEFNGIKEMKEFAAYIAAGACADAAVKLEERNVGNSLNDVVKEESLGPISAQIAQKTQMPIQAMTGQVTPVEEAAPVHTTVPTTQKVYTLDELASAAMTLMDKGMQPQLQELLAGYGVEALPMLPAEQYGNFATALRGMGAQI